MACARCAEQATANRAYCGGCGASLLPSCSGCGVPVPAADLYCGACGTPRAAAATTAAAVSDAELAQAAVPPDDELLPSYPARLFGWLLMGLAARFAVYPFLSRVVDARLVVDSALIVVMVWVALLIERDRRLTHLLGALGILTIAVNGLTYFIWLDAMFIMQQVLMLGFYGAATLMILRCVLRREQVTLDKIYGAVCAYLLIAYTWGFAYDLLQILQPDSFRIPELAGATGGPISPRRVELAELIYFSFMTMTSVGYTDIAVNTDNARTLILVEAIVGQIYPVVLIARLVNLQVTHNAFARSSRVTSTKGESKSNRRPPASATDPAGEAAAEAPSRGTR